MLFLSQIPFSYNPVIFMFLPKSNFIIDIFVSEKLYAFINKIHLGMDEESFKINNDLSIEECYNAINKSKENIHIDKDEFFLILDKAQIIHLNYYFYYFSKIKPELRSRWFFDTKAIVGARNKVGDKIGKTSYVYYIVKKLDSSSSETYTIYSGRINNSKKMGRKEFLKHAFQLINNKKKKLINNMKIFILNKYNYNYNYLWEHINDMSVNYNHSDYNPRPEVLVFDRTKKQLVESNKLGIIIYKQILSENYIKKKIEKYYIRLWGIYPISFSVDEDNEKIVYNIEVLLYENNRRLTKKLLPYVREANLNTKKTSSTTHLNKIYFFPDRENNIKYKLYAISIKDKFMFIIRNEKIFINEIEYQVAFTKLDNSFFIFIDEKEENIFRFYKAENIYIMLSSYTHPYFYEYTQVLVNFYFLYLTYKLLLISDENTVYLKNTTKEETTRFLLKLKDNLGKKYMVNSKIVKDYNFSEGIVENVDRYIVDMFNHVCTNIYKRFIKQGKNKIPVIGIRIIEIDKNMTLDKLITEEKRHSGFLDVIKIDTKDPENPVLMFEIMY